MSIVLLVLMSLAPSGRLAHPGRGGAVVATSLQRLGVALRRRRVDLGRRATTDGAAGVLLGDGGRGSGAANTARHLHRGEASSSALVRRASRTGAPGEWSCTSAVVVMALAIVTSTSYTTRNEVTLATGQSTVVSGQYVTFHGFRTVRDSPRDRDAATRRREPPRVVPAITTYEGAAHNRSVPRRSTPAWRATST